MTIQLIQVNFSQCPLDCEFLEKTLSSIGHDLLFCKRYEKQIFDGYRKGICIHNESICPNCYRKGTYQKVDNACSIHEETWLCSWCKFRMCFDNIQIRIPMIFQLEESNLTTLPQPPEVE
jgi:hypothetical protein